MFLIAIAFVGFILTVFGILGSLYGNDKIAGFACSAAGTGVFVFAMHIFFQVNQ